MESRLIRVPLNDPDIDAEDDGQAGGFNGRQGDSSSNRSDGGGSGSGSGNGNESWIRSKEVFWVMLIATVISFLLSLVSIGWIGSKDDTSMYKFCTNSTFYYFDVPPFEGDLGNYSRVTIERIGNRVHVYMQGLLFYGVNSTDSAFWDSTSGFPSQSAIGIDTRCIPSVQGSFPAISAFTGAPNCTSVGKRFGYFNVGNMYISILQPTTLLNALTTTFLEGGSPPACIANLPDPGVNVLYHHTQLNPDWFIPSNQWIPYGWMVDFTYKTDSSVSWEPPHHCTTSFRNSCSTPR